MDFREIDFCPSLGNCNIKAVAELLADKLFSKSEAAKKLLTARYEQLKRNCVDVSHDNPLWDLEGIIADHEDKAALLPVQRKRMGECGTLVNQLWEHANFGHDMPFWMVRSKVIHAPHVMIITQDPRRTGQDEGILTLSTPFAFHSITYRKVCCYNHTMFHFIRNLIYDSNACVYITDCRKFYTSDDFVRSNAMRFKSLFDDVLRIELSLFKADLIVTLGNDAADSMKAKHPNEGLSVQNIENRSVIAAHHTCARPYHFTTKGKDWCKEEYFIEVFKIVQEWLNKHPRIT